MQGLVIQFPSDVLLHNFFFFQVHFVHFNSKYADLATAADKSDGLAVLGFFFEEKSSDNSALAPVISQLSGITSSKSIVDISSLTEENLEKAYSKSV